MSITTETRKSIRDVEVVTAYCDKCGALIDSAESYDDGYNPALYAGEFKVKIDISSNNKGQSKRFEAALCEKCTEEAIAKIKDGMTKLFVEVVEGDGNGANLEN